MFTYLKARARRRLGAVIVTAGVAAAIVSALSVVGAPQAQALGEGTGCMINAPNGATVSDQFGQHLGHVGWAFQEGGTGRWFFGATENGHGTGYVAPGGDTQSWIASAGNQTDMLAAFKSSGHFHSAGYYTQWRCRTIPNTAIGAALKAQHDGAASGYNVLGDNCLTKAVAILNAYGEGLAYPGYSEGPNFYFDHLDWVGWGPKHPL